MSLKELPSDIPDEINSQRLPSSDHELEEYLHSLAHTIRTSFNDYAFTVVTDSDSIKIPTLENIIALSGLEERISWRYLGNHFEQPDSWSNYTTSTLQRGTLFEGLDETGGRLIDGHLAHEGGYVTKTTEIEKLDPWTRKTYGISLKAFLRRYATDESELAFALAFYLPIEPGEEFNYDRIHYVDPEGKHVATSYDGKMARRTRFLSYWDKAENFGIYYHEPFFQREKEGLTKPEVKRAYNLRESLKVVGKESEDSGLLAFLEQEEKESGGVYNMLKTRLGLDRLSLYEQPSILDILRLDELAQFLESRFRKVNGLNEISHKDYKERIAGFRNQLWLLLRPFSPYGQSPQKGQESYHGLTQPWIEPRRELYPKGLGPFDPGPHNPGGPGDPRGPDPRGPDPRGPDPRGRR